MSLVGKGLRGIPLYIICCYSSGDTTEKIPCAYSVVAYSVVAYSVVAYSVVAYSVVAYSVVAYSVVAYSVVAYSVVASLIADFASGLNLNVMSA